MLNKKQPRFDAMRIKNIGNLILLNCLLISFPLLAESNSYEKKIDDFLVSQDFSGVFMAVRNREVVHHRGYGYSNFEAGRKTEIDNQFRIGSLTKDFTVALIILLLKEGIISSQSDPIVKYLPEYPLNKDITVGHLIKHRSGIPDLLGYVNVSQHYTLEKLLSLIAEKPLNFKPGSSQEYSNSNYILLGAITEAVTKKGFYESVNDRLFRVLGIENTAVYPYNLNDQKVDEVDHAIGYIRQEQSLSRAAHMEMSIPYAAGAYSSNTSDLKLWVDSLLDYSLITETQRRKVFDTEFGFDWEKWSVQNKNVYSHAGGIFGFSAFIAVVPKQKRYVIFLSNKQDQYEYLKSSAKHIFTELFPP